MSDIIWRGRRSIRSMVGYVTLLMAGFYLMWRFEKLLPERVTNFTYLVFALAVLELLRRIYNVRYTVTPTHIIQETGLLGLVYKIFTINFEDIRDIKVHQTLIGRIFNFGTVAVGTAAEGTEEIFFQGVKHPHAVAEIIKMQSSQQPVKSDE